MSTGFSTYDHNRMFLAALNTRLVIAGSDQEPVPVAVEPLYMALLNMQTSTVPKQVSSLASDVIIELATGKISKSWCVVQDAITFLHAYARGSHVEGALSNQDFFHLAHPRDWYFEQIFEAAKWYKTQMDTAEAQVKEKIDGKRANS